MKILRAVLTGSLLVIGSQAFAQDEEIGNAKNINLDDLRAKCREFVADPQYKPVKVRLTCSDFSQYWDQSQQKGKLRNPRKTGVAVQMKTFQVPNQMFDIPQQDLEFSCPMFVKKEKTIQNVEVDLTCSELLAIDNLTSYCSQQIDRRVKEDPEIVQIKETGEVEMACPGSAALQLQATGAR